MSRVTILSTVNTKSSKLKALDWIRRKPLNALFLDFPIYQESFFREIARGRDWREVLQRMIREGLIKEPEDTQSYRAAEPLLMQLAFLEAEVFCFRDPLYHDFSREVATEILILTMRAKIGKVDAEEWKELIGEEVGLAVKCSEWEARCIANRALEENVCIDASEEVGTRLREKGYDVRVVELDRSQKPLDILREKMRREILFGEKVPEDAVERLVMEHLKFTDLVVAKDFEEAYREWCAQPAKHTAEKYASWDDQAKK